MQVSKEATGLHRISLLNAQPPVPYRVKAPSLVRRDGVLTPYGRCEFSELLRWRSGVSFDTCNVRNHQLPEKKTKFNEIQ